MTEPGELKQIVSSKNNARVFGDVQWDGQHIWIATYTNLWIVDTQGNALMKSTQAEGLPSFDHTVLLHVLGPDRLVIAGVFGPNQRAFLGLIERDGKKFKEKVLLEAARIDERNTPASPAYDVDFAFRPRQLARCRTAGGGDFLIVSRDSPTVGAIRHPLIVDLKTFKVWASDTPIASSRFLNVDGKLLQCLEGREEYVLWRLSDDAHSFVSDLPHLRLPDDRGDPWSSPNNLAWTVGPDGNVYLPGYMWFRIDPRTMMATCLAEEGPPFAPIQGIAVSHEGLFWWGGVGGKGSNLYRVNVDETKLKTPPKRDWQPPAPPIGNAGPATIFDLTAEPLTLGGRIGGTLLLTRAKEPPYSRKVVISVSHADRLICRSSQRISLLARGASPFLRYQWLARAGEAADVSADPMVIRESGDYRVEVTICSDDDREKALDHRTLNLSSK